MEVSLLIKRGSVVKSGVHYVVCICAAVYFLRDSCGDFVEIHHLERDFYLVCVLDFDITVVNCVVDSYASDTLGVNISALSYGSHPGAELPEEEVDLVSAVVCGCGNVGLDSFFFGFGCSFFAGRSCFRSCSVSAGCFAVISAVCSLIRAGSKRGKGHHSREYECKHLCVLFHILHVSCKNKFIKMLI